MDDYEANGIYCALNGTVSPEEFESNPHYTKGHYVHVAKPNMLRYEVALGGGGGTKAEGERHTWMLLRVTRTLTSQKNWLGVPVYLAKNWEEKGESEVVRAR